MFSEFLLFWSMAIPRCRPDRRNCKFSSFCKIFMNFDGFHGFHEFRWMAILRCVHNMQNHWFFFSVNFYSFHRWLYLDVNRIYKIAKFDHFSRFPSFSLNSIDSVNFDDSDKLLISWFLWFCEILWILINCFI